MPVPRRVWAVGGLVVGATSAVAAAIAFADRLPVAPPIVVEPAYYTRLDTLRRDEPLAAVLLRRGVPWPEVARVLDAAPEVDPRRVRAGRVFDFRYPLNDSMPERIALRLDDDRILRVGRASGDGWRGTIETIRWRIDELVVRGVIGTSLYDALHAAIPDSLLPGPEVDRFISDIADDVFGWDIDFSRDLLPGDGFSLAFERRTSSLGDVRYRRLVAARIDTRGETHQAYLLAGDQGRPRYFDDRGVSLQRAFKRNPVAYLRISSRFSSRRLHPVLGTWRAHRGTDYKAHSGTEIHATGEGTVRFAGRNGGYGIMVAIRHPNRVETRYAHMSRLRPGIRPGIRVGQGEVIGYVGSTGLASGPHVHYEFLKDGRPIIPHAADLGDGTPLPEDRRAEFEEVRDRYAPVIARPVRPRLAAAY